MEEFSNKLDFSRVLVNNKHALHSQEFQTILLYCNSDRGGRPTDVNKDLELVGLKVQPLIQYHFDILSKNNLLDVHIVAYKSIAKKIMKYPLAQEMISKMNIKIHVLQETDEPSNALKLIIKEITKDFIVFHGHYYLELSLKEAIASHKINDSDMTMVLGNNEN